MVWYLTDQMKSHQVLNKIKTLALFSVKNWMTVDKIMKAEEDY